MVDAAVAGTVRIATGETPEPRATTPRASIWLRLSVPIALLAIVGSLVSLVFQDAIYGRETASWTAQSIGQDVANLFAFPVLLVASFLAMRGSIRAYLIWVGLLIYSSYTYAIYAFALHFGPLFLVWVAVFGLSVYALIGALTGPDARRVRIAFRRGTAERRAARLLIWIGSVFALLWLSEIVPAMLSGTVPDTVNEAGLFTNPVYVLDLALFLPALVIGGMLLRRGRPLGYVLASVLLTATFFLAIGIISLMLVSAARGLESAPAVGAAVAILAILEAVTAIRLLRRIGPSASRRRSRATKRWYETRSRAM